jgi:Flp pilus assembly pilin Flp
VKPHRSPSLVSDSRGTVMVEYVIVLCLVAVGAAVAIIALGTLLLELFRYQQALLVLPFP